MDFSEDLHSLQHLVDHLDKPSSHLIAEVNGVLYRGPMFAEVLINDQDRIELIHFVGGGSA